MDHPTRQHFGTGDDLRSAIDELVETYEERVAAPMQDGADSTQIVNELVAGQSVGFAGPGCPGWLPSNLAATSTEIADTWIRPTELQVDNHGRRTVYFYAGGLETRRRARLPTRTRRPRIRSSTVAVRAVG